MSLKHKEVELLFALHNWRISCCFPSHPQSWSIYSTSIQDIPFISGLVATGLSAGGFPGSVWLTSSFVFLHVGRHFEIKAALNVYIR